MLQDQPVSFDVLCNALSENHEELRPRLVKLEVVQDHLESSCGAGEGVGSYPYLFPGMTLHNLFTGHTVGKKTVFAE